MNATAATMLENLADAIARKELGPLRAARSP